MTGAIKERKQMNSNETKKEKEERKQGAVANVCVRCGRQRNKIQNDQKRQIQ
jgi:hypothetical protein